MPAESRALTGATARAATAALLLAGAVAGARLPFDWHPTTDPPALQLVGAWPGASPEVIERYVTAPIEALVQGVRGVKRIASISSEGSAFLSITLAADADPQLARLAIREGLDQLRRTLPQGAGVPVLSSAIPKALVERPLLTVAVRGPLTPAALQTLLDDQVIPRLAGIPGIGAIDIEGGARHAVSLRLDPRRLRQLSLASSSVDRILAEAGQAHPLGSIGRTGASTPVVLHTGPATLAALRALPVAARLGVPLRLEDVAAVGISAEHHDRLSRVNGRPALTLQVTRQPTASAASVAGAVRDSLRAIAGSLPSGVQLPVIGDESRELAHALRRIMARAALAIVALLLMGIVMGRRVARPWPVIGVVGTTLVSTMALMAAITALLLFLTGQPVTPPSLAIGTIVMGPLVTLATRGGRKHATWWTAIPLLGMLSPFLLLTGIARTLSAPAVITIAVLIIASVVAASLGSCLAPWTFPGRDCPRRDVHRRGRHAAARRRQPHRCARAMRWLARRPPLFAAVGIPTALVVTAVAVHEMPATAREASAREASRLTLTIVFPKGVPPDALDRRMQPFEAIAVGAPGVREVRATSDGMTTARVTVRFDDTATGLAAAEGLRARFTQRAAQLGGVEVTVAGDGPAFASGSRSGLATYRLELTGYSYDGVTTLARDLASSLARMPRVRDVRAASGAWIGANAGRELRLEPDRLALERIGAGVPVFTDAVARVLRHTTVPSMLEVEGRRLPIQLREAGQRERQADDLLRTPLSGIGEMPVTIGAVATLQEQEVPPRVERVAQRYVSELHYDVRAPPGQARRLHVGLLRSLRVPPGYTIRDLTSSSANDTDDEVGVRRVAAGVACLLPLLIAALLLDRLSSAWRACLPLPFTVAGIATAAWWCGSPVTQELALGSTVAVGVTLSLGARLVADGTAPWCNVIVAALATSLPFVIAGTGAELPGRAAAVAMAGGTLASVFPLQLLAMLPRDRQMSRTETLPHRFDGTIFPA